MEFVSTQRYIRMSPRKLRESTLMVRGLKPTYAIEILPHSQKRGANVIFKALKVAIANATNKGANPEDLILKEIQVSEGPRLKRFRAGSRGAAKPYQRRMSHLRIVLQTVDRPQTTDKKAKSRAEKKTVVSRQRAVSKK